MLSKKPLLPAINRQEGNIILNLALSKWIKLGVFFSIKYATQSIFIFICLRVCLSIPLFLSICLDICFGDLKLSVTHRQFRMISCSSITFSHLLTDLFYNRKSIEKNKSLSFTDTFLLFLSWNIALVGQPHPVVGSQLLSPVSTAVEIRFKVSWHWLYTQTKNKWELPTEELLLDRIFAIVNPNIQTGEK